jgi:uncharacterized membrane protein YdjX (TVP38/TMEM64 family)
MQIFNKHWLKLAVVLVYLGLGYFLLRVYNIDYSKLKDIDHHIIRENIKALGIWIPFIYVVFYILRPLILFPATVLSILGGVIFGYFWGMVLVMLGAMLSAVVEFSISRHFGRKLLIKYLVDEKLLRWDKTIQKHGFKTVFFIRLIPNVAFDVQNFSLGLTGVKFSDYFFATLFGIIPASFIYVYLGCSFLDFKYLWKVIFILLGLLILYFSANKLMKLNKLNRRI